MTLKKKRAAICFVSTIAPPLGYFMGPHIRRISDNSKVTLVADGVSELALGDWGAAISFKEIPISRQISMLADLSALWKLWRFFRICRFDCVHSIMPKSGLLSMLAAAAAGVPVRFHTFTGQVWVTRTGMGRRFFMAMDWLIARLATSVLTDSSSQREFLIANKIVKAEKIDVLGLGSIVGVDATRFVPDSEGRMQCRQELGIGKSDIVFVFVGRLAKDKGITDLLRAFEAIANHHPEMHLLLVGPDEEDYDINVADPDVALKKGIHRVGFTLRPELYMAAADVICLPSYREGFGSVLIEAAACELPAVASRIYGITDAVVDGVTGILHEPGNVSEMVSAMIKLAENKSLRQKMGAIARSRAIDDFSQERLTIAFEGFYRKHGVI